MYKQEMEKNTVKIIAPPKTEETPEGVKAKHRITQKVREYLKEDARTGDDVNEVADYGFSQVTDVVRITVEVNTFIDLADVLTRFTHEFDEQIIVLKNKWKSPQANGYSDINLVLKVPGHSMLAEVQFQMQYMQAV